MFIWKHLQQNLNPGSYLFWLLAVSLFCFALERIAPWRKTQRWQRPGLLQDTFFLFFNGHVVSLLIALTLGPSLRLIGQGCDWCGAAARAIPHAMNGWPIAAQVVVFFVVKDLLEYVVHYLLHHVHWLWIFHRLHHSIDEMDWIGNFRFHWMEILVYDTLKWLPLVFLATDYRVVMWVGVASTLVGHLNHANVRLDWGPLRYVLNSPRMHIWHHDYVCHRPGGQNFAVVFSAWDWIFRTAYFPYEKEGPERLGFEGMERFPKSLLQRMVYPLFTPST